MLFRSTATTSTGSTFDSRTQGYEVDSKVSALADPNESQQWALSAAGFTGAWSRTNGSGVVVAVVAVPGVEVGHQV